MLQLMAVLEASHSALRWLGYTEHETPNDPVRFWDRFMARAVGTAWSAEAFRLLKEGNEKGLLNPCIFSANNELTGLWHRITSKPVDPIIGKIHAVRDKYVAHFDPQVINHFIAWQDERGATESFFVGDDEGTPLKSRYLWPLAATIYDLFPDPSEPKRPQLCDLLLNELDDIWAQTGNLIAAFLDDWVLRNQDLFEVVPCEGD